MLRIPHVVERRVRFVGMHVWSCWETKTRRAFCGWQYGRAERGVVALPERMEESVNRGARRSDSMMRGIGGYRQ